MPVYADNARENSHCTPPFPGDVSLMQSIELEKLAASLIKQEMSNIVGLEVLDCVQNTLLPGLSGHSHQIDVLLRFMIWETEFLVLVECKAYGRKVEIGEILEFKARLDDTRAHKGIFITTEGFQAGAYEYAKSNRIALFTLKSGQQVTRYLAAACRAEPSSQTLECEGVNIKINKGDFKETPRANCEVTEADKKYAYNWSQLVNESNGAHMSPYKLLKWQVAQLILERQKSSKRKKPKAN